MAWLEQKGDLYLTQRWFTVHWRDCGLEEKQKSLLSAFPDAEYTLSPDETEEAGT
jgi:hypothetical protein